MIYRIVRTRRKGNPLTRAEQWHSGIEAPNAAEAIRRFRATSAGRVVPMEDLEAIAVERKRA